jgi:hypothetical protein
MFATFPLGFLADTAGSGGGGGGGGAVTISIAPSNRSEVGFASSWVFPGFTATVTGGVPSAYVWSFRNEAGGLWQVFAGQGTASAAPSVDFIPGGGEASAEFVCTATVLGVDYSASGTVSYTNIL